ncbi:3891_t:CDS:2, partial [Gigaspora rosea]
PILNDRKISENEDELENKIGEELMENIQLIIKDCEELVGWEAEIDERLKVKTLLIKERYKILQIINSNGGKKIVKELSYENIYEDDENVK